jgi:putative hydrolase of the HAD superfamily
VRAVVFDYFGTLTPPVGAGDIGADMARIARALEVDVERFSEAMTSSWPLRSTGMLGDARATLVAVARMAGGSPDATSVDAAFEIRMRSFVRWAALRPEVASTVDGIRRRGLAVGVVTDCPPEMGEVWDSLEIAALVDVAVRSSDMGVRKPDPGMFLAAATGLGVEPGECWYVGDGGSNELAGSAAVGMRPVWLDDADPLDRYVHGFVEGSKGVPRVTALVDVLSVIDAG